MQSQLVVDQASDVEQSTVVPLESDPAKNVAWSARTSFTADSPYFDAFCDSEIRSLGILSETLHEIVARSKTLVKQGIIMSEATRRLGLSCKLHSSDYSSDDETQSDDGAVTEEELSQLRRSAVGEEMAGILELLGEVRSSFATTVTMWRSKIFYLI